MGENYRKKLESGIIGVSAPCRVDLGGTLDISTFHLPLRHLCPSTFNLAIDMRTTVRLLPYTDGMVKISSRGFEDAEFPADKLVFDHPMGLMFAVAAYFGVGGVHIDIDSSSPPRSALGGSSVAAVALVTAFLKLTGHIDEVDDRIRHKAAMIAHAIENSVLGVPCGVQDQLAAAYGGIHSWQWTGTINGEVYVRKEVAGPDRYPEIEKRLLVAYCGVPHESVDINGRWVRQFLKGENRGMWEEVISSCNGFSAALEEGDYSGAIRFMNRETELRRIMTPDVLDEVGRPLIQAALENDCGARFTGAGGGGCVWAIGEEENIGGLKKLWADITAESENGRLLHVKIDGEGLKEMASGGPAGG